MLASITQAAQQNDKRPYSIIHKSETSLGNKVYFRDVGEILPAPFCGLPIFFVGSRYVLAMAKSRPDELAFCLFLSTFCHSQFNLE